MNGPQRVKPRDLNPSELGTTEPADLSDALATAGRLGASIEDLPLVTGPAFSDRVMAALADEPTPAPVGFLTPLRRLGLIAGFGASVRQAWASITAPDRPTFARGAALAYVLVIAIGGTSLAGAATIGLAGAIGLLGPHATQAAPSSTPFQLTAPDSSARPSGESEPPASEASEEPSETPGASDDRGGSGGPEPSDDRGGSPGPGSSGGGGGSDDGSGGGGASPTSTPGGGGGSDDGGASATGSPKPSQTPRPTGTPRPSQTSGSDGGSASSD